MGKVLKFKLPRAPLPAQVEKTFLSKRNVLPRKAKHKKKEDSCQE